MRLIRFYFVLAVVASVISASVMIASASQKTLASTLDIFVFPTSGQDASQQSTDEAACYNWAVESSGSDPFALTKQAQQQDQQTAAAQQQASKAGTGSGARGAIGGAAVGALIGEIDDDDAGKGAAIGGAVGLLRGRRVGRRQQAQAQQQVQQQSQSQQQVSAGQMDSFKRAFSVCLEAKNYMVK
jgi:Glycine zipper